MDWIIYTLLTIALLAALVGAKLTVQRWRIGRQQRPPDAEASASILPLDAEYVECHEGVTMARESQQATPDPEGEASPAQVFERWQVGFEEYAASQGVFFTTREAHKLYVVWAREQDAAAAVRPGKAGGSSEANE